MRAQYNICCYDPAQEDLIIITQQQSNNEANFLQQLDIPDHRTAV